MAPTAAQFSPGQILEAGRRAENDGRVGYAIQFYRHLTDHHGWSPEAAIAKEALARLANFRPPHDVAPPQVAAFQGGFQNASAHQPAPQSRTPPPSNGAEFHGNPGHASHQPVAQMTARTLGNGGSGQQGVQAAPQYGARALPSAPPLRLPAAERRYRVGSVVAWLLFGIGLLLIAASFVLAGLHSVGVKVPGAFGTMLGFTGGLPGALAIFVVGICHVFAAQIGRALFDNANAMRDLVMIERAKISHAAGDQPFGVDEDEPA
jgi:hypothetical protein